MAIATALRALRILSTIAFAGIPAALHAQGTGGADTRLAGLGEYIERVRQEWQVPGVAVGVIADGKVVYARGFGSREIGKAAAVDERTLFEIGSLTKAFTATALALLVEEGRIGWDDPVVRHLPSFRLSNPAVANLATIRDLVAHRTGYEGGMAAVRPMTAADILREADRLQPIVPFRDEVLYSNSMYSIAGEVVAAVSGMSWAEFVQRRLLSPLGMAASGASVDLMNLWDTAHLAPSMYGQAPAGRAGIEDAPGKDVAMPHYHTTDGVRALPWQISLKGGDAAGSMVSNLEGMLAWTSFNLGNGTSAAGGKLLQPATLEELHRPQHIIRHAVSRSHEALATLFARVSPSSEPDAYAMGWFSQSYRGQRFLSHGGALLGGMSLIAMLPERDIGVVVLANSYGKDGNGLFNDAVAMHVLDALLGEKPYDWNGELAKFAAARDAQEHASDVALQKARLRGTRPSLPLDRYVGEYENAQFGKVRIERSAKGLRLRLPGVLDWPLEHWHNDTFRMQISTSGVPIFPVFTHFEIDPSGRITSFDPGWVLLGDAFVRSAGYDTIIRGGTVYDGTGADGKRSDVGIRGARIAAIGDLSGEEAAHSVDASGLAVAPGFINMLSQASFTFLSDGRSESDIRQGVTLEMLGEGMTMGPLNPAMRQQAQRWLEGSGASVDWTTQEEYMRRIERQGVAPNIASFVGATSIRVHVLGYENRKATAVELARMEDLVRQAMEGGAFGVTSAVQYAPAVFADTDELAALAKAAAPYGGMYISHLRDEDERLVDSVEELIEIARRAGVPAEIHHLKAFGRPNWPRLEQAIQAVEAARKSGLRITADMYPYTAAFTGLDLTMPPWVQEGGDEAWIARLKDPAIRARVLSEMREPAAGWSNALQSAGSPDKLLILGVHAPSLKRYVGKTIGEVARERKTSPEDTIVDLVVEDGSRLQVAYFAMSEENVRRQLRLPWVSFGSDGDSVSAEGEVLNGSTHPRDYGTFARVLGKYVREEKILTLAEAVRRLSGLPASTLGLNDRGLLREGHYADVVVFDPRTIGDRASFEDPHQYAQGMRDVWVNGVRVLEQERLTGAKPGRYLRKTG